MGTVKNHRDKQKYIDAAHIAEQKYGLPRNLLVGLLGAESNFNPNAKSSAGALGVAQFMPATAKQYGIDPLNPEQSIDAAGKYLASSYKQFGNWDDSLRSYNMGVGGLQKVKAGKKQLPKETREYTGRVYAKAGIKYDEPSYANNVEPYINQQTNPQQTTTAVNQLEIPIINANFAGVSESNDTDSDEKEDKQPIKEAEEVKQQTNEYNFLKNYQEQYAQQEPIQIPTIDVEQTVNEVSQFVDNPVAQQGLRKPLDTGHFKTTTGKVVVWGTPEYREAYDRGEVVTDKGVKSPVTIQGGQLDEVVVQNNYKKGFWEKYKDKIIEENKDAGVLGAIVGTPISAVASLPQLAMMEGLTGKMQRPSEAMSIQNPYGAMAVDAVTDPANLIGAGVLTKEKVLAGLARSTEDGVLSNAHKLNPFSGANSFIKKVGNDVGLVKDLIFDKNTTLNKNFIFDSKSKIYNQIEEGYRTLDNSLEQKINELGSEEGRRRLINQEKEYLQDFYYDPKNVDLEKAATENADARIEELENIKAFGNKNKEFAYNVDLNRVNKTGIIKPNIESVQYRYEIPTNNAHYQYTDDIIDNPSGSKMLPGTLTLGRGYEDSVPTAFHEINHALQRGRTLKIDNELKSIVPDFKKNMSYDDIDAYTYFKSGSDGKESSSFLAELRSQMQQDGFIKNTYDNVTPELIEKAKDYYSKNKSKKVFIKDSGLQGITNTRLLDFSRATPENYKIISDAMNKLPVIAPIAGASYLATQGQQEPKQFQQGGKQTIKDQEGQRKFPNQVTEIQGNKMATDGYGDIVLYTVPDKGTPKIVMPNTGEHTFKGATKFTEYPITKEEQMFLEEYLKNKK